MVKPDDARIKAEYVEYASPQGYGKMRGYLVRPAKAAGKLPGGAGHSREPRPEPAHRGHRAPPGARQLRRLRARRAVPARRLSRATKTRPATLFPKLDQAEDARRLRRRGRLAEEPRPETTGKIGVVGFCYGGGIVNFLATRVPDLAAGVPFYGSAPNLEDVPKIKARAADPVRRQRRAHQRRWPAYEAALKAADVRYERHLYPGTQHGFNNDTTPRYDAAAAKLAWERTIALFNKHLR